MTSDDLQQSDKKNTLSRGIVDVGDVVEVGNDSQQIQHIQPNQHPHWEVYFEQLNTSDRILEVLRTSEQPLDNKAIALLVTGKDDEATKKLISELRRRLSASGRIITAVGGKTPLYTLSEEEQVACQNKYSNWLELQEARKEKLGSSQHLQGGGEPSQQLEALITAFGDRKDLDGFAHVTFEELLIYLPGFADAYLDNVEHCEKALEIAGVRLDHSTLINIPSCKKDYTAIEPTDEGKLIIVEGDVVSREPATEYVISCKFECPSCGKVIPILQMDITKFKEPSRCECGRKGFFKEISRQLRTGFRLLIEELPSHLKNSSQQAAPLEVFIREPYYTPALDRIVGVGQQLVIVGYLYHVQLSEKGVKTSKYKRLLNALYWRPLRDDEVTIEINEDEMSKFKEFAELDHKKRLQEATKIVFPTIAGHEEVKEILAVQTLSGTGRDVDGRRDKLDSLLVGGMGGAKSSMADGARKVFPKNAKISVNTSKASLAGAAYTDPLTGQTKIGRGFMARNNKGAIAIHEINLFEEEAIDAFLEPLEEGTSTVSKGTQSRTDEADCTVFATCNPKLDMSWTDYTPLFKSIGIRESVLTRFDYVLPVEESKDDSTNFEITKKIVGSLADSVIQQQDQMLSFDEYRRYCLYVKTKFPVSKMRFSREAVDRLATAFQAIRNNTSALRITRRDQLTVRNTALALARSALRNYVTVDDVEYAYQLKLNEQLVWNNYKEDSQ